MRNAIIINDIIHELVYVGFNTPRCEGCSLNNKCNSSIYTDCPCGLFDEMYDHHFEINEGGAE